MLIEQLRDLIDGTSVIFKVLADVGRWNLQEFAKRASFQSAHLETTTNRQWQVDNRYRKFLLHSLGSV
ncbi:MAG: hypothetical protein KDB14_03545 [Planctomycetales bacterium]|nr:hypothetical protein [Planctomycetales bacterium]